MVTGALFLTQLTLSGFRTYASARLAFDARPVVITGANGAGKTNLVEAVSMLSPGRGLRAAASEELVAAGAGASAARGWRAAARVTAPDGRHEIETAGGAGGRRVAIDGKAAPQMALASVLRVIWLTPAMDRLWVAAPAERRRFLDRITMSLTPDHAEAATGYERALRERNRLIRDCVTDRAWFAALEARMGETGAILGANRRAAVARLAEAQVEGAFPAAALALETHAPEAAADLAAALAEGRGRDIAAGRTLTGPHRDDLSVWYAAKGMPARLASTGEQKALILSVTLANTRAVASAFGAPPILLLDEVAAHLDTARRTALFEAVLALGAQAWMTGTDAHLFSALGDRTQWLVVQEEKGRSFLAEDPCGGNQRSGLSVEQTKGRNPSSEGVSAMTNKDVPEAVEPGQPGSGEDTCPKCEGTGKVDGKTCPECEGSGKVTVPIGGA